MQKKNYQSPQIVKLVYRKSKLIKQTLNKIIWEVNHIHTGDTAIVKTQFINQNSSATQRTVLHQGKFLQTCQGSQGIPFLIWCGKDEVENVYILIQEKLGKTLGQISSQDMRMDRNKLNINSNQSIRLSIKSVIMIGLQLIKMVSSYHQKGYVHRNLNLDSIQFGCGSRCDRLFFNDLIDSKSFYKKNTFQHIERKTNLKLKKLNIFWSPDVLKGIQPSRKDDIYSIVLILVKLIKGSLPWQQIGHIYNKSSSQNILLPIQKQAEQLLRRISLTEKSQLFDGVPIQIVQIYKCVLSLGFNEKPDYSRYIQLLNSIMIKNNWQNDNLFDWMRHNRVKCKHNQGGQSIRQFQWLIIKQKKVSDEDKSPKKTQQQGNSLIKYDYYNKLSKINNQVQTLRIYQKHALFIGLDRLGEI